MLAYKNNSIFLLLIIFSTFPFSIIKLASAAEANLIIPKDFNVLAINGQAVTFKNSGSMHLRLRKGNNRLALEYFKNWRDKFITENSVVRSKVFVISFNLVKQEHLTLNFLKPANLLASRQYALDPKVNLHNSDNKPIDIIISYPYFSNFQQLLTATKPKNSFKKTQKPIVIGNKKILNNQK